MKITLQEIARFLGGDVIGAADAIINDVRPIEEANEGDITFIAHKKYLAKLKTTKATAILAPPQTVAAGKNLLKVFAEGVVFYNLKRKAASQSWMAKLRRDMFDWLYSDKIAIVDYDKAGRDVTEDQEKFE